MVFVPQKAKILKILIWIDFQCLLFYFVLRRRDTETIFYVIVKAKSVTNIYRFPKYSDLLTISSSVANI